MHSAESPWQPKRTCKFEILHVVLSATVKSFRRELEFGRELLDPRVPKNMIMLTVYMGQL